MSRPCCLEHSILWCFSKEGTRGLGQGQDNLPRYLSDTTTCTKPCLGHSWTLDQWNLINLPKCSSESSILRESSVPLLDYAFYLKKKSFLFLPSHQTTTLNAKTTDCSFFRMALNKHLHLITSNSHSCSPESCEIGNFTKLGVALAFDLGCCFVELEAADTLLPATVYPVHVPCPGGRTQVKRNTQEPRSVMEASIKAVCWCVFTAMWTPELSEQRDQAGDVAIKQRAECLEKAGAGLP